MKNLMSRIMLVRSFAVFCFLLGPVWPVRPVPSHSFGPGGQECKYTVTPSSISRSRMAQIAKCRIDTSEQPMGRGSAQDLRSGNSRSTKKADVFEIGAQYGPGVGAQPVL